MDELKKINEVIDKYFRDERIMHFQSSDALINLAGESYLRYEYYRYEKSKVVIFIGSNEGETPVKICNTAEDLERLIKAITSTW